jgi:pimeloyl-ACP methyl ester carboxylesterase
VHARDPIDGAETHGTTWPPVHASSHLTATTTFTTPILEACTLDVGGVPVALRRKGRGRPLLFVHGAGFTGKWLRFHEALAARADVIAPEQPGLGATPAQEWIEDFDDLVLHYDALRRELGIDEPFDLVGYSLGGWIAARYATWFPERLRSLTLIVPAGMRVPGQPPAADMFMMSPEQLFATLFNDVTNAAEVFLDITNTDVIVHAFEEASTVAGLVWERRSDRKLERRLARVTCPALIVGAENDRLVPNAASDRYAEILPNARVRRIPGTGHAIIIEQPEATAKTILDFQEAL